MVYLDYAATSWPKPPGVLAAMGNYLERIGANPGRSGHRNSANAARVVFDAREALARLLGVSDSRNLLWTFNATQGINTVLRGMLRRGGHVIVSGMEHNAVMRPLAWLGAELDLRVTTIKADGAGRTKPEDYASFVSHKTQLVVVNHASNVCGTIQPIAEIKDAIGDVPLLVDAAQTAGALPINAERDGIDLLAVTGHKSLLGPQGTGALYIRPELEHVVEPLVRGGTGSHSESVEQPVFLPDRYEGGTSNAVGIAGLGAAVLHLEKVGVASIRQREAELCGQLLDKLREIEGLTLFGPLDPAGQMPVVSLNVAGWQPSEVGLALDRRYDIACRVGLHCAPVAHRSLGTFDAGTVRLSLGEATTAEDVEQAAGAIHELAAGTP